MGERRKPKKKSAYERAKDASKLDPKGFDIEKMVNRIGLSSDSSYDGFDDQPDLGPDGDGGDW